MLYMLLSTMVKDMIAVVAAASPSRGIGYEGQLVRNYKLEYGFRFPEKLFISSFVGSKFFVIIYNVTKIRRRQSTPMLISLTLSLAQTLTLSSVVVSLTAMDTSCGYATLQKGNDGSTCPGQSKCRRHGSKNLGEYP